MEVQPMTSRWHCGYYSGEERDLEVKDERGITGIMR